jgi:uncharacterized protein YhhL (DUF1145 family)
MVFISLRRLLLSMVVSMVLYQISMPKREKNLKYEMIFKVICIYRLLLTHCVQIVNRVALIHAQCVAIGTKSLRFHFQ